VVQFFCVYLLYQINQTTKKHKKMTIKVEEFRTQEFRDIINHIACEKGYVKHKDLSYQQQKIQYNFTRNGEIKQMTICGVSDDYVAIFRIVKGNRIIPIGITYNDYLKVKRDVKLSKIFDRKTEIKSTRKVVEQKPREFQPVVGMELRMCSLYTSTGICEVVKVTPKQFKYKLTFGDKVYTARLSKSGRWIDGSTSFENDVEPSIHLPDLESRAE